MITYIQFLKKIYSTIEFRATSELMVWITVGCLIAWWINPNTFNPKSSPGLEFFIVVAFGIHGVIRFAYLLFRSDMK